MLLPGGPSRGEALPLLPGERPRCPFARATTRARFAMPFETRALAGEVALLPWTARRPEALIDAR